jgi:lipid II:glycine glycyltransferase (peptidoglycan interpeptide bridge formation enzyme)
VTNKERYIYFCKERKDVPLFQQPWWLGAVCSNWDVAIADKGTQISGIWPYAAEKVAGVPLLRNPRLTPYFGPHIFYPKDIKDSNRDGFEHDALTALLPQLPPAKVWHLAIQPGIKQAGILRHHDLQLSVQQTFLIDLLQSEQQLLANMKENMRRNIRAAEKEITIINAPEYLPQLYEFQKSTLAGKGRKQFYNLTDLQKVVNASLANNAAAIWVAKRADKVLAVIWHGWDGQNSYYLMGAQNPETDNYTAMSALLWHAIKKGKENGNTTFDMEGSMDPGVERFFRNFAGERTLYMVLKKNESRLWKIKELLRG